MPLYYGFSTIGKTKNFKLTDFELAKRDLMNHLQTRKGERLMKPNFGTIIWNVLFEPLTLELQSLIEDDLNTIISYDPRIQANSMVITTYENGIQIAIDLTFLQTDERDTMVVQFDNGTNSGGPTQNNQ